MAVQEDAMQGSHQATCSTILSTCARLCAVAVKPSTACPSHLLYSTEGMDVGSSHLSRIRGLVEWAAGLGDPSTFYFQTSVEYRTHRLLISGCASKRCYGFRRRSFVGQDEHIGDEQKLHGISPPHQSSQHRACDSVQDLASHIFTSWSAPYSKVYPQRHSHMKPPA